MCGSSENQPSGTGAGTGTIAAGVRSLVPNHPACAEALSIARSSLPASILYHSLRVYLYAQAFIRLFQDNQPQDNTAEPGSSSMTTSHILFVACILHDAGVGVSHDAVPERFEVVSADLAARVLRAHGDARGTSEAVVRDAWLAMALHTSPGIAERLGGTARALRLAVRADFGSYPPPPPDALPGGADTADTIRWKLPRLEIEKDLGDAVVRQALGEPLKAPGGSWPGDLLRAKREDPTWEGVNKGF